MKKRQTIMMGIAMLVLTLLAGAGVQAQNLLTNGGFESPTLAAPPDNFASGVEGWSVSGGTLGTTFVDETIPGSPNPEGKQELFGAEGDRTSGTYWHITQTFGPAQANATYTFAISVFPVDLTKAAAQIYLESEDGAVVYKGSSWNPAWSAADFTLLEGQWTRVSIKINTSSLPAVVGQNLRVHVLGAQLALDNAVLTKVVNPTNLLKNPSFELPARSTSDTWFGGVQDWQDLANSGIGTTYVASYVPGYPNPDGNQEAFAALGDRASAQNACHLAQTIGTVQADTLYTFTVDLFPTDLAKAFAQIYLEDDSFTTEYATAGWNPDWSMAHFTLEAGKWTTATVSFSSADNPQFVGKPLRVRVMGTQLAIDNALATAAPATVTPAAAGHWMLY